MADRRSFAESERSFASVIPPSRRRSSLPVLNLPQRSARAAKPFATAVFSGVSNLLMLTGALFMLEIYDRILPSRSVPTLVALLILVAGLYAAQGMIDTIRSRILVRVGHSLNESMSSRVYDAIIPAAEDRRQRRGHAAHSRLG